MDPAAGAVAEVKLQAIEAREVALYVVECGVGADVELASIDGGEDAAEGGSAGLHDMQENSFGGHSASGRYTWGVGYLPQGIGPGWGRQ